MAIQLPADYAARVARFHGCSGADELDALLRRPSSFGSCPTAGLRLVLATHPDVAASFFATTLPHVVERAAALPALMERVAPCLQRVNVASRARLPRAAAASMLAAMLLDEWPRAVGYAKEPRKERDLFPGTSFRVLLASTQKQEAAKLRMFVHYFERIRDEPDGPPGELLLQRSVLDYSRQVCSCPCKCGAGACPPGECPRGACTDCGARDWLLHCEQPLLPLQVVYEAAGKTAGIEDAPPNALQADFANQFLGGGVLCGGCVQEEIRFAIAPELTACVALCPVMYEHEAIAIGGAPIYSRYRGYGWGLQYDGDHPAAEASASAPAATSTIAAIDATDYRSSGTPPAEQFARRMGEREVLKAYAGFSCCADDGRLTAVATGNWGSGAFHGFVDLKAIEQWIAASIAGRSTIYYPFGDAVGGRLGAFAARVVAAADAPAAERAGRSLSVGEVWRALLQVGADVQGGQADHRRLFEHLGVALGI